MGQRTLLKMVAFGIFSNIVKMVSEESLFEGGNLWCCLKLETFELFDFETYKL